MAGLSPTIVVLGCWLSTLARSILFSASRSRWRRALRTTSTVFSSDNGFSMKSKAPILIARTADSILPWPEMITTCESICRSRSRCRVVSPSSPGSQMSSTITS